MNQPQRPGTHGWLRCVQLIMRRSLFLVLLVLASASCGVWRFSDCNKVPLPIPVFEIEGAEGPESQHLQLNGEIVGTTQEEGRVEITVADEESGQRIVRLDLGRPVQIDLSTGSEVEIDFWQGQGFEGTARGIRISDDSGVVLIAEDGDYGNAIPEEGLAPFAVAQTDAGCRNHDNQINDYDNFKLVVSAGGDSVELIHGETDRLTKSSREYSVLALRSVASPDDVILIEAPYGYTSFVIAGVPVE